MDLLDKIVAELRDIPGIDAVVLGGSRATGSANPESDYDIGIYYGGEQPLDLAALNQAASRLDDSRRPDLIGEPGSWGPWVNAGGWLTIDGTAVDFVLRDTRRVTEVVADCMRGKLTLEYQVGHPFGFLNGIYMGELSLCQVLHPTQHLTDLKKSIDAYPPAYQQAIFERFGFSVGFYLMCGRKGIAGGDIPYAAGCLFHAALSMVQVVFAANGQYLLNEKGWQKRAAAIPGFWMPDGMAPALEKAFSLVNRDDLPLAFITVEEQFELVREHLHLP